MFWAYCVQNKTKIEAEHSGATYQMSGLEEVGLLCLQCSCLSPGAAAGAGTAGGREGQVFVGGKSSSWGNS